MLKIIEGNHIRYLNVGQLKALLAQVEDDRLLVTSSSVTGNLVFYRDDSFEDMVGWINFGVGEELQFIDVE